MESKANIANAILNVMAVVKGIEKDMVVGTGSNAYKGIADQIVKKIIGSAMKKEGLSILPIGIEAKTIQERWNEPGYNNQLKSKQSIFTEVITKYLLLHTSGESIEVAGYGHGVDSQDKGAGKATTYALKYTLLYLFLVPTGKIDDADNEHSDDKTPPPTPEQKLQMDIAAAIQQIAMCSTIDELTILKGNLDKSIFLSPAFKAASLTRYNELKSKV